MEIIETIINGLSLGGTYAMIALGYTMVYGIAKMLNFAHGDIIMVGGYVIYVFMATQNPLLAVAMAVIFCVLLGIIIEKVAYKPLRGSSPLAVLITAIGVSYLLQSLAQMMGRKFDLVFLDPPYAKGLIPDALRLLTARGLLAENATLVCESAHSDDVFSGDTTLASRFTVLKQVRYGVACVTLLRYDGEGGAA